MEEFSLKKLIQTFRQYQQHCLIIVVGITSSVVIYALCQPKTYMASATIMAGESTSSSNTSALGQLVGLTSSSNNDFTQFMAIINSRSFKEQLVDSLGVSFFDASNKKGLSEQQIKDRSVGMLGGAIQLRVEPDFPNVLKIMVQMNDPNQSPVVANQLLSVLQSYIQKNSVTRAKRLRQYIENNILETKASLFETANKIASFYNKYPINQAKGIIETPFQKEIEDLSINDQKDEVNYSSLPEPLTTLTTKRKELLQKLQEISQTSEQTYFTYLQDEFNILKSINLILRQQYEMTKLEEIKEEPSFQILDRARGSHLTRPGLRQTGTSGFAISLLITIAYLLLRMFYPFSQKTKTRFHLEEAQVIS